MGLFIPSEPKTCGSRKGIIYVTKYKYTEMLKVFFGLCWTAVVFRRLDKRNSTVHF